jgi:hypothetical protein
LKVLNHLVLSSVNGEVNRNVLIPNRMSVSSQSDAQPCLFGKALFNHQGETCAKAFLRPGRRKGSLADESLSADQTTSGIGPPSEGIVTVCIGEFIAASRV